jgi:hypothetical protein
MGASAAEIRDLAELELALATPGREPVALVIGAPVPGWLADAVSRLRRADRPLQVRLAASESATREPAVGAPAADARAGQEIGMVVAVLDAGVHPEEIRGPAPERVRRVAEVLNRWDQQASLASEGQAGVMG